MKILLIITGIVIALAVGILGGIFYERYSMMSAPSAPSKEAKKERKVLYYKCPMGEPDYSDTPGKARCGMDYVPVYEDEAPAEMAEGEIYLTPEKIQRMGVRSEEVTERALKKVIRTVATVDYDERRLFSINTKLEGWIERLYINSTGREVKKGEPLLDTYSPELISTQEEYLLALETKKRLGPDALPDAVEGADSILNAAKRRLRNWDINDAQIEALEKSGKTTRTLTLHSPAEGVVIEKMAIQGMKTMSGEKLFTIADISNIWLHASIYEYELSLIKTGQKATVTVNAYPSEIFRADVSYVYPYLDQETRTAKIRLEMKNPGFRIKPGMYANIEIESVISPKTVAVPEDALLDTGERQAVIIDEGGGRFKMQEVKVGLKGEGYYQILSGLAPGWKVVTSANFLIDSESSFRSTAQTMLGMEHGKKEKNIPSLPAPLPMGEGGQRPGEGSAKSVPTKHKGH